METNLHIYHPKRGLLLLEYTNRASDHTSCAAQLPQPDNVLLFIGGLYDTFRSPGYVDTLAALFPRDEPDQKWRVMHVQLSSAGRAFGLFNLDRDVDEISAAIRYIRESITKSANTPVVIMGHSTGCQDVLHYLCSPGSRKTISGAIMQAPVSDREAILDEVQREPSAKAAYESALSIAANTAVDKHKSTILPTNLTTLLMGPAPLSVARFLSLASPDSPARPAMDDYFSSDLSDQRLQETFGRIGKVEFLQPAKRHGGKSILILESGIDAAVPASIDKDVLLSRWKKATEGTSTSTSDSASSDSSAARVSVHSMIIPHAVHDISGTTPEARTARLVDMRGAVLRYLEDVVGHIGHEDQGHTQSNGPWAIWTRDRKEIELDRGVGALKL